MNRDKAFQAMSGLDDRYIEEAIRYAPGDASGAPERIVHMKRKRIITLALAAVLLLAIGVGAYAVNAAVTGPKEAERVARQELEVWKELGLLNPELNLDGTVTDFYEFQEDTGNSYWYHRIFHHSYSVRFHPTQVGGADYSVNLHVDTLSGKIVTAFIAAYPREGDAPTDSVMTGEGILLSFYDTSRYIFPADMTVDRFCTLLAEYWGFTGYRIADTLDDEYLHAHLPALDGSTLLSETASREGYYLTVFFEGDQEGAPMYIALDQYGGMDQAPGYMSLNVGTRHAVG